MSWLSHCLIAYSLCYSSAPIYQMLKSRHASRITHCLSRLPFLGAPMLDWTDRHCRYFLRLLSRNTLLYTEMVTTGAIIHGKGDYGVQ